jgi:hypothetical protein
MAEKEDGKLLVCLLTHIHGAVDAVGKVRPIFRVARSLS